MNNNFAHSNYRDLKCVCSNKFAMPQIVSFIKAINGIVYIALLSTLALLNCLCFIVHRANGIAVNDRLLNSLELAHGRGS